MRLTYFVRRGAKLAAGIGSSKGDGSSPPALALSARRGGRATGVGLSRRRRGRARLSVRGPLKAAAAVGAARPAGQGVLRAHGQCAVAAALTAVRVVEHGSRACVRPAPETS